MDHTYHYVSKESQNKKYVSNKICSVPQCCNRAGKGVSLHCFPLRPDIRKQWVNQFKMEKVPKDPYACSEHFMETDFHFPTHQTKLKRLQSSAIPSRNLPLHKQLPQTIIIDEEIDESATEGNSKRQGNNFYHNVQKDSERYTYAIKSVLLKIREKKHILFGPKTKTINAEHKSQEWGKIFSFACNLGLVGKDGKFWDYMRDVFWPNIKGRTIAKINKGYEKLEEIDDLVIDIIGKELLVFAEQEHPTPSSSTSKSKSSVSSNSKRKKPEILEQNKKCKKSKTASSKKHQGEKQTEKTGKTEKGPEERRRELQVEYLKLLNEKLKIETYNLSLHSMYLERELGLSCSKLKKPCLEAERFHDKDKE